MRSIVIRSIPHSEQRYPTVGDYWLDADGVLQIRVSEMSNPRFEELVAMHELSEALLVLAHGVSIEDIDKFDMNYEANRSEGDTTSEPGNSPDAPYRNEHIFATEIEGALGVAFGVDWREYEKEIESL